MQQHEWNLRMELRYSKRKKSDKNIESISLKTHTVCSHFSVELIKAELLETESRMVIARSSGNREMLVQGFRLSGVRRVCSKGLTHSTDHS